MRVWAVIDARGAVCCVQFRKGGQAFGLQDTTLL